MAARQLAARHGLAPRHLEPLLRDLVRAGILKGTRGPRGGYELARERRRISAGDIVRAVHRPDGGVGSRWIEAVVLPALEEATRSFLNALDTVSIEALVRRAEAGADPRADPGAFVI